MIDKKREFMAPLRPHERIWNFEIEDEDEAVDHVLRPGADPRKSYIDGRIEKLLEKIERLGTHLRVHDETRWGMLAERTWEIFDAQEKDLVSQMKIYYQNHGGQ